MTKKNIITDGFILVLAVVELVCLVWLVIHWAGTHRNESDSSGMSVYVNENHYKVAYEGDEIQVVLEHSEYADGAVEIHFLPIYPRAMLSWYLVEEDNVFVIEKQSYREGILWWSQRIDSLCVGINGKDKGNFTVAYKDDAGKEHKLIVNYIRGTR